jgi:hypothetical protein
VLSVDIPSQGGKHDSRRSNSPGSNPFCYGSYRIDLFFWFNRILFNSVIEEGDDEITYHRNDYRAADYLPVSHEQLQDLQNRQYPAW